MKICLLRWCLEGLTGYSWNIDTGIWLGSYGISDQICWSATISNELGIRRYQDVPELYWFWVPYIYVTWINVYFLCFQVTQGTSEFKPAPPENREFFKKPYSGLHTLLVVCLSHWSFYKNIRFKFLFQVIEWICCFISGEI